MISSKVVGIVGNKGKMAVNIVEPLFKEAGCEVIGSDIKNPSGPSNKEVAEGADVVYFSVSPICDVAGVINGLIPFAKPKSLWLHGTSIQNPAGNPISPAMLSPELAEKKVDTGFLHFMVGPMVRSLRGQSVVYGFYRELFDPEWKEWLTDLLNQKRPFLMECSPEQHDDLTTGSQLIPQLTAVAVGQLWKKGNFSLSEVLRTAGPPCWLQADGILRNLMQNEIIANIIVNHPNVAKIVDGAMDVLKSLKELICLRNVHQISEMAKQGLSVLSKTELDAIKESVDWHIRLEGDMRGGAICCVFQPHENKLGLLTEVLKIFDEHGLDKTSCMAQEVPGGGCVFYIGVKADIESQQVRQVCEQVSAKLGGKAKEVSR